MVYTVLHWLSRIPHFAKSDFAAKFKISSNPTFAVKSPNFAAKISLARGRWSREATQGADRRAHTVVILWVNLTGLQATLITLEVNDIKHP